MRELLEKSEISPDQSLDNDTKYDTIEVRMTRRAKRIKRFRENDKNVRFEEIDGLLIYLGFTRTTRGSHHTYRLEKVPFEITIPYRKPFLLPVYVKQVLAILDEYFEDELDA